MTEKVDFGNPVELAFKQTMSDGKFLTLSCAHKFLGHIYLYLNE